MIVLSVDTCDARGSVCVLRDDVVLGELAHGSSQDYSSWLIPAFESALRSAGLSLSEVNLYAAASGPGSFTGLRVGLTTIKALAEVYTKPIAAVSRLEVLASLGVTKTEWIAATADAGRGQVFGALYGRREGELVLNGETIVAEPNEFIADVAEKCGAQMVGWVTLDPDSIRSTPAWHARESAGESLQHVTHPLAQQIGRIGSRKAARGQVLTPGDLEADYVRRSDAEIFWKGGARSAGHRG